MCSKLSKISYKVVLMAMFVFLLGPVSAWGEVSEPGQIVLFPGPNTGQLAVTWWDEPTVRDGQLLYSPDPDLRDAVAVAAKLNVSDDRYGYASFEVSLAGLQEGIRYYYQVDGSVKSEIRSFVYHSGQGVDDFSFLYLGDAQYNASVSEYEDWGALLQGAYERHEQTPAFALLGGDMVNNGQNGNEWRYFLTAATPVFSQLPMLAVPGNHESSDITTGKPTLMNKLLALPENGPAGFTEEFYYYDYGDCHIVALNSNIFLNEQLDAGSMSQDDFQRLASWLAADLAASQASWKIVVMHHPAYVVVRDRTAAQVLENWGPIFDEAGVDLVLCGHQHIYMRTSHVRGGQKDPTETGLVQIMSNSGAKHYARADVDYAEKMIENVSTYQRIQVSPAALTVSTHDSAGAVLDSVILSPREPGGEEPEPQLPGDVNGDGTVDWQDVRETIAAILVGDNGNLRMDINNDGIVNIVDAHRIALLCP